MLRYLGSILVIFILLAALLPASEASGRAFDESPFAAEQSFPGSRTVVTDMRVGLHNGKTRIVFDLTNQAPFDVFTLADPYRVVIDLPEVGWHLPSRPLPQQTGLLAKLRYGLFKQGVSRVVLEITGPAAIDNAFMIISPDKKGYRIVIDLAETNRQAFINGVRENNVVSVAKPAPSGNAGAAADILNKAQKRQTASALPPAITKQSKPKRQVSKKLIAIDPGHGGIDPGAIGSSGIYEKQITLTFASEIKRYLEATGRFNVLLTRDSDVFVKLRDRVAIARNAGAELFISIHADAINDRKIQGLSVYTLSEKASDKEAAALADKENKSDLIAGLTLNGESAEVTNILIDLAQRETMNQSALFASTLVKHLRNRSTLLRQSHRFAGFAVLKAPDIPSVLLELGFLSNRMEESALRKREHRAKLVLALSRAVEDYFTDVEQANSN